MEQLERVCAETDLGFESHPSTKISKVSLVLRSMPAKDGHERVYNFAQSRMLCYTFNDTWKCVSVFLGSGFEFFTG